MQQLSSISLHFRPSMPRDLLHVHSPSHLKQFPQSFRLTQAQTLLTLLKCISLLPVCTASHPFWSPLRECSGLDHSRNDPPSPSLHQSIKKQLLMIETGRWLGLHHLVTSAGASLWSGSVSHSHLESLFSWMYIFLLKEDIQPFKIEAVAKTNALLLLPVWSLYQLVLARPLTPRALKVLVFAMLCGSFSNVNF